MLVDLPCEIVFTLCYTVKLPSGNYSRYLINPRLESWIRKKVPYSWYDNIIYSNPADGKNGAANRKRLY